MKRRVERLERRHAQAKKEKKRSDPYELIDKAMALPDDHPIKLELLRRLNLTGQEVRD